MKARTFFAALALGLGATLPALGQSIPDLPRLTWPTETVVSTQNCTDATRPGQPQPCVKF